MNSCVKAICSFILVLFGSVLFAQELSVKAPSIVAINTNFNISYTIEGGDIEEFIPAAFSDFKVIAGPVQAFNSNTINGVNTAYYTFTYYVQAPKEGIFDIPQAEVKLKDGTKKKFKKQSVEVIKETPSANTQNSNPENISSEDLFIRMELNKQSIYKSEPIILTLKLYSYNVAVTSLSNFVMPALAGFDAQELPISSNESGFHQQKYNNRIFQVATLARVILFPLMAGDIKLDPLEVVASIQIRNTDVNDIRNLVYGSSYKTISKSLKSTPVTIKVKDFPAGAPASFNGATGNFTLASNVDKTSVTANQAISYTLTISGAGNFKQIPEPLIIFPDTFDKYDPKITENLKPSNTGSTGSKKYEYVVIPRAAGQFEIPPVEFTYFDTQKESYVTLTTKSESFEIAIDPNGANAQPITSTPLVSGKKVEHLGNDILFIKTTPLKLKQSGYVFFGSLSFWIILLTILVLFVVVCVIAQNTEKNRQNIALMRNRKANKVAINRLKQSAKILKLGDRTSFYEEVSKALWGYISDKMNMQGAELSRDNVQGKLAEQNVPQENIDLLLTVIDKCEYARYAPDSGKEGMEEMYNEAITAISRLENLK